MFWCILELAHQLVVKSRNQRNKGEHGSELAIQEGSKETRPGLTWYGAKSNGWLVIGGSIIYIRGLTEVDLVDRLIG
jgi:hypothetical protein